MLNLVFLTISCLLATSVVAFVPNSVSKLMRQKSSNVVKMSVFDEATKDWARTYPDAYQYGFGPTTKAERWNGRHAMFGWIALIATGYAKSHGLIPNADSFLDLKEWGSLALVYGGSISNERAVILAGHVHLLLVSVLSAFSPLSNQDRLLLEPGEKDEPAAGLIPKIVPGLTKEAELLNGRLAMLGLVVLITYSAAFQVSILDAINTGLGGLLL
jgi:hypothetical protein